jgi:hypothetical protein
MHPLPSAGCLRRTGGAIGPTGIVVGQEDMQTMAPKRAGKIRLAERILLAIGTVSGLGGGAIPRKHFAAGPPVESATPRSGVPTSRPHKERSPRG